VYPGLFRAHAELLLGRGDPPAIRLRAAAGDERLRAAAGADAGAEDTFVEAFGAQGDEPRFRLGISALRLGYWPSAVLIALLLATPMPAARRAIAIAIGLLWLDAFALGRLGVEVGRAFAELARGDSDEVSGALLCYRTAANVLSANIVVIAAVLLGWAALARPRQSLALGSLARVLGAGGARS
jgi:hypothetical protein